MGIAPTLMQWLNVAINVVLPIVVAVITNRAAEGWVKAVTLLILSALSGFGLSVVEAYQAGAVADLGQSAFNALIGLVIAVAVHFGVWKPAGVTGADGAVQRGLPAGFGARR